METSDEMQTSTVIESLGGASHPGATEQAGGKVSTRQAVSLQAGECVAGRVLAGYAVQVAGARPDELTVIPT